METGRFTSEQLLGRGWALPVRRDAATGEIVLVAGADAVAQSIWSILATAPGERVGRPQFGCAVGDLVFGSGDSASTARVGDEVRAALELWEPRIELLGVRVEHDPAQARMLIDVEYRLRTTSAVHNLVFPLALERAG